MLYHVQPFINIEHGPIFIYINNWRELTFNRPIMFCIAMKLKIFQKENLENSKTPKLQKVTNETIFKAICLIRQISDSIWDWIGNQLTRRTSCQKCVMSQEMSRMNHSVRVFKQVNKIFKRPEMECFKLFSCTKILQRLLWHIDRFARGNLPAQWSSCSRRMTEALLDHY